MNRFLLFIWLIILSNFPLSAINDDNDFNPDSKTFAKVYSNFHLGISHSDQNSAFEITRAYFGFQHSFDPSFTAVVKLDIGSPNDESEYSKLKRYAYFKNAALLYNHNNLTLSFGLIDLLQFKTQDQFCGKRYIYKSFQDEYKFGPSADIGASIVYQLNKKISFDFAVTNGEGYNSLQSDNTYKTAAGITSKPIESIITRVYFDYSDNSVIQNNFSAFVGFIQDKYKLAAEYNFERNFKFSEGNNAFGYSFYGSYNINSFLQLFGKYDILRSNKVGNSDIPWNLSKDGSAIIAGIEYKPHKNISLSLNYQDWYPFAKDEPNLAYIYFNIEFAF